MRHSWIAAAALAVVAACGGKTQSGGEGGLGTGGGGGNGLGGASTGGASTGGTGGASTGGSGAVGYGGSGGSGFGGVGAGGSGTGGGTSIDQKIAELCKKISQLPCGVFDCENQLHQSLAEATANGCFAEIDLVFDCALSYPLTCESPDPGEGPALSPQCAGVAQDLEQCMQGNGQCSSFGGTNGCGMDCSGPNAWGVKCTSSPAGLDCICTNGPNQGLSTVVSVECNSPAWQETVANLCS